MPAAVAERLASCTRTARSVAILCRIEHACPHSALAASSSGLEVLHCFLPLPPLPLITVINKYVLMLNKLGVLAFLLMAGLSGYGQSYPIDTAWAMGCRRLLRSPTVHARPGSPPAHTQLTLISWVAYAFWHTPSSPSSSVMPTLSCTQPATYVQHTPQPMLFVYCVRC